MRFTYAESMTDPSFYMPLAQAAEGAGFHAMTIADSVAYPFESDATYPYTPDGSAGIFGAYLCQWQIATEKFGSTARWWTGVMPRSTC